jgi:hypothetical protein
MDIGTSPGDTPDNLQADSPQSSNPVPPAPASLPASRKRLWLWLAGLVVLVGLIVVLVVAISSKHTTSKSTGKQSTGTTQAQTKVTSAGLPVSCNKSSKCVPGVDINRDIVPRLQAAGYTCAPVQEGIKVQDCRSNTNGTVQEIVFSNTDVDMTDTNVGTIQMSANVGARGTNPPDLSQDAWNSNVDNFHKTVAAVFTAYPKVAKDLDAWAASHDGSCGYATISDHDTVDQYELSCMPASPISVSGSAGTVTSWTSIINLDTPLDS